MTGRPLALVDHHVHGAVASALDGPGIESLLTEAVAPPPAGTTMWDTQLGFAVRRLCAPVLGLEPSAPPGHYVRRRTSLGRLNLSGTGGVPGLRRSRRNFARR